MPAPTCVVTIAQRARAALDEAFSEAIKRHFTGFLGQIDDDLGKSLKADAGHFTQGIADVKAAYEAAIPIIEKAFGDAS